MGTCFFEHSADHEEFLVVLEPRITVENRWLSLTRIDADNPNLTAAQTDIILGHTIGAQ